MNTPKILVSIVALLFVGAGCVKTTPVFVPSVITEFTSEDRVEWRKVAKWSDQCEDDFAFGADESMGGLSLFSYESNQAILRVTCGVYAYQTSMLLYHVTIDGAQKSARQLSVPTYDVAQKKVVAREYEYEDDIVGTVLGFDTFNPKEKTLTIFVKDRGVGDCGTRETFAVDSELTLQKVEYQSCEAADEFHLQNPEAEEMPAWPVVYQAK